MVEPTRNAIFRILDANSNRVSEGLRTLEEFFRFVVEDRRAVEELKQLRHDLADVLSKLDRHALLSNRNATEDIGQTVKTRSELERESMVTILTAAAQRVQQALRSLEEYSKLIDVTTAAEFEKLRYRAYDKLARLELLVVGDRRWLANARLYVLIDCQLPIIEFLSRAQAIAEAGVDIIQIRDKHRDSRLILDYAHRLIDGIDSNRTRVIFNDRVDLAAQAGHGVHLGQDDLTTAQARPLLPWNRYVGISTHSMQQALEAVQHGADYIGCGPTFPSETKEFADFPGLSFLSRIAAEVPIPAFAIGGISLDRLEDVLATGIHGVAVSQAIWQAHDPAMAACQFAERLRLHRIDRERKG